MIQDQDTQPTDPDRRGAFYREAFSVRECVRICSTHAWWIVTITSAVLIGTALTTFTATEYYRATQRILIEREADKVLDVKGIYDPASGNDDYYLTQYSFLESRAITEAALQRLPEADRAALAKDGDPVRTFEDLRKILPVRKSRLVDIQTEHPDPRVAERMAQALQVAFVEQGEGRRDRSSTAATEKLRADAKRLRLETQVAAAKSHDYRVEHGIVSIDDRQSLAAARLESLSNELAIVERKLADSNSRLTTAKAAIEKADFRSDLPEVLQNRVIAEYKMTLLDTSVRLSQLTEKYKDRHPRMVEERGKLEAVEKLLTREVHAVFGSITHENQRLKRHRVDIEARIRKQTKVLAELDRHRGRFKFLQAEAETSQKLYDTVHGRLKEVEAMADYSTINVHPIGSAQASDRPVRPRKVAAMGIALLLGLLFSIALSFLLDAMNQSIQCVSAAERALGVRVLGLLPRIRGAADTRRDRVAMQADSPTAEAFRTIRTNLTLSHTHRTQQGPLRTVAITSTSAGEGKSMVALNLATAFARAGRRVLLVDAEMRRPRLHKALGIEALEGFSSVLVGEQTADDVIHETDIENLDFLPCGVQPPNPVELLSIGMGEDLRDTLLEDYDLVVFDTPPVGVVSDACVLAPLVDSTLFVVRVGHTDRGIARRAVHSLLEVGGSIGGVILNHTDRKAERSRRLEFVYDSAYAAAPAPSVTIPAVPQQPQRSDLIIRDVDPEAIDSRRNDLQEAIAGLSEQKAKAGTDEEPGGA